MPRCTPTSWIFMTWEPIHCLYHALKSHSEHLVWVGLNCKAALFQLQLCCTSEPHPPQEEEPLCTSWVICVGRPLCHAFPISQGDRLQLDRLVNTFSSSGRNFQRLQQVCSLGTRPGVPAVPYCTFACCPPSSPETWSPSFQQSHHPALHLAISFMLQPRLLHLRNLKLSLGFKSQPEIQNT